MEGRHIIFNQIIKEINENKKLVPDLLKAENGNNFRAVSESAILDVVDPVLKEAGVFYTVEIKDQNLEIREAFGSKGKKLQFIATVVVRLAFFDSHYDYDEIPIKKVLCVTEAVGMGIDDNDKAMGKAYTYAVKYALLKLFRLRYGDDADFEASKSLYLEKPKEEKKEEEKLEKEGKIQNRAKKSHKNENTSGEIPMSEAQRDYILGLMKKCKVEEKQILEKFGVEPTKDEFIPMKTARAIIKWFEDEDYLPF